MWAVQGTHRERTFIPETISAPEKILLQQFKISGQRHVPNQLTIMAAAREMGRKQSCKQNYSVSPTFRKTTRSMYTFFLFLCLAPHNAHLHSSAQKSPNQYFPCHSSNPPHLWLKPPHLSVLWLWHTSTHIAVLPMLHWSDHLQHRKTENRRGGCDVLAHHIIMLAYLPLFPSSHNIKWHIQQSWRI